MTKEDGILLETYMMGFNDELANKEELWNPNPLLLRAYHMGRVDAIVGDDVSSSDLQTNEEILKQIRTTDE